MLWRGLRLLLAMLVGLAAFVAVWVASHLADPAIDDHDLRIERPAVPDAQNGLFLLERAAADAWWPAEQASRLDGLQIGTLIDPELEREAVARNENALAQVPSVLAAPVFVVPTIAMEERCERCLPWRRLSALLAIRAVHRARADNAEGAVSDALAAASLGARIESGPGASLFEAMIGVGMKQIGLRALGRVLGEIDLDAQRSRELTQRLSTLHVDPEGWRRMWAFEYENHLRMIAGLEELDGDEGAAWLSRLVLRRYVFKPNATDALFAETFRTFGEQGGLPCARARWPAPPPEGGERAGPLLGPNGVGRVLSWIALPHLTTFALRRCEQDARVEAARAWVALRAYSKERGDLPGRLEELVPTYLAEVPTDAFDGATLRYDPKQRLLWSVGSDFVDAGGSGEAELEPVFPIPF
jgi:hypothetical protein